MIKLGKILKPHGLKGQFKVLAFYNSKEEFKKYPYFFIGKEKFEVETIASSNKFFIIKLKAINSIQEVENISGHYLALPRRLIKVEQGDLIEDYLGLAVYDAKNKPVGFINNFLEGNGKMFFEIGAEINQRESSRKKNQESVFLPCQKDLFYSVDFIEKKVFLDHKVFL